MGATMSILNKLKDLRDFAGPRQTVGLADTVIESMAKKFPDLVAAVDDAHRKWQQCRDEMSHWFKMPEKELIVALQDGFLNFYQDNAINPYVAFTAKGPWIISTHGAVIHDNGGYGMLGLGHGPSAVIAAMSQDVVMANIMTANFAQRRFLDRMFKEVGHARKEGLKKPFAKFLCLNSGSESMTVACRISDIHAKIMTDPGGRYAGRKIRFLSQNGSFHGRTEKPARMSHSSHKSYKVLASFREDTQLDTFEPGNVAQLREFYANAEKNGVYYEALFIEPVMGEGNPGVALTREFYDEVRKLTKQHGTMLVMDAIQAGLRATGRLSMCDYPGFEDCDPPDMETYSKAINAGQYPLSVLAMSESAAALYKKGVYGNTMTTNPRALEVACAVLDALTPALRRNIVEKGEEFLRKFRDLAKEFPGVITKVQGTGLLFSVELAENGYTVLGKKCVELDMRLHGIGVIHGGKNALRFTPHFGITSDEIDMVIEGVRVSLSKGPIYKD
jgi:acetylornithine/succinyldiaminopimelate/putrescine aminotransferase